MLSNSVCPYSAARMCQFLHPGDEGFEEKMRAHQNVVASQPPPQPTLDSFVKSQLTRKVPDKTAKNVWGDVPTAQESKFVEGSGTTASAAFSPFVEGDASGTTTSAAFAAFVGDASGTTTSAAARDLTAFASRAECKSSESDCEGVDSTLTSKKQIRKIRKKLRRIEQYKNRPHAELSAAQQQLLLGESQLRSQLSTLLEAEKTAAKDEEIWERAEPARKTTGEVWELALNTLRVGSRYSTPRVLSSFRS